MGGSQESEVVSDMGFEARDGPVDGERGVFGHYVGHGHLGDVVGVDCIQGEWC